MTRFDFNRGFVSLYDEFDFVSIGGHGDWAFGVNGKVEYRCCYGLGKKIVTARRKIESIVMSPIDRCRFLALDDGTIKYDLPDVTKRYVDSHCKPRYSLINPDWNASSSDWSSSSTDEDDDEDDTPDKEEVSEDEEEEVVPKTGFVQGIAPKVSTSLRLLVTGARYQEPDYRRIAALFKRGWKHPNKPLPDIQRIYRVDLPDHLNASYSAYKLQLSRTRNRAGPNEQLLFHGNSRSCRLGDSDGANRLCSETACNLCGVLRQSFAVARAGTIPDHVLRFGRGIYTTSVSSEADDCTDNHWTLSNRVLVVARVLLGDPDVRRQTAPTLTSPANGKSSVRGDAGLDLTYDEQVIYRDDAIRPAFVVVYDIPEPDSDESEDFQ